MKCNKCGYASFDHNQNCPKCNYDLVAEATKMNLPSYAASPPYLLASLLGGKDEYVSVTPSHDQADNPPEKNSGISMLDDIELPHRTILPGLAEAVAELAKKEDEDEPKAIEIKDISIKVPNEQQKPEPSEPPKASSGLKITINRLGQSVVPAKNKADTKAPAATVPETTGNKQEYEDEDIFEFILDDEQPEKPELKAEPEPESKEITLTVLPEENIDEQKQHKYKIEVIPEKKAAQDDSQDDLIELTMEDK